MLSHATELAGSLIEIGLLLALVGAFLYARIESAKRASKRA